MNGILDGAKDLFGLPLLAERGRGRPAHTWTLENSNKINLLFACGYKPAAVAKVIGITKPTLYKHYFNEVARAGVAPLMLKAKQLSRLNALAEDGNVAAEKALAAMVHAERLATQAQALASREPSPRPVRLGKKEEAAAAALGVGGIFAPPAPPAMIN